MITEVDLLNTIHENADMGQDSLSCILQMSTDPQFTREIRKQKAEYEEALEKSEAMLRERNVTRGKEVGAMSKMMGNAMAKMKNMADPSTSKLAEMVFQGNNMGITNLTKTLNDYTGDDREVRSFAERQLRQEEKNAETIKKYL